MYAGIRIRVRRREVLACNPANCTYRLPAAAAIDIKFNLDHSLVHIIPRQIPGARQFLLSLIMVVRVLKRFRE